MSRVHARGQLLGKLLHAVHNHLISTSTSRHGDLAQRVPSLLSLLGQPGDDPDGGIVLVQGRRELLAGARELLLKVVRL